ncbi:MAG: HNH endonuclease [Acidobacteria bacterium]|nr:HNH endonuclease [Acidobacteriota bacterium]
MQPWEKSRNRRIAGGWVKPTDLPRGENGRALCRWCQLEVPKGRRTFCSDWCIHEWRLRSDPGYLRDQVLARDRGVCAQCAVDTVTAYVHLKRSRGRSREALLAYWGLKRINRATLWDADHIIPVVEGGGECDLNNIRTLCLRCHKEVTKAALRGRRASTAATNR